MKYLSLISLCVLAQSEYSQALRIKTAINAHGDDTKESKLDSDLDALMDKYDTPEKKPVELKKSSSKVDSGSNASSAAIQDAELKIL
jgi:hypothetical protein